MYSIFLVFIGIVVGIAIGTFIILKKTNNAFRKYMHNFFYANWSMENIYITNNKLYMNIVPPSFLNCGDRSISVYLGRSDDQKSLKGLKTRLEKLDRECKF